MALTDYASARPWAKAIKQAVVSRAMPPWFADPHFGSFRNDPRLTDAEVQTISEWVEAGAPQGNPKDATKPVAWVDGWRIGEPDVVVYNAAGRVRGPFIDLDPGLVEHALAIAAFGGFLVAQEAAKRMLARRRGAILFTGATASVKGFPHSSSFAMGKFALRGLAQSLARELAPQGIHVAHFVIDGGVRGATRAEPPDRPDSLLDPDAIAETYWQILQQPRSAWTWEVELRPWVETF